MPSFPKAMDETAPSSQPADGAVTSKWVCTNGSTGALRIDCSVAAPASAICAGVSSDAACASGADTTSG